MFPKRFINQHTFFSQSGARDLNKANALAAASLASKRLVAGVSLAFGNVPCLTVAQFTILHSLFPQPWNFHKKLTIFWNNEDQVRKMKQSLKEFFSLILHDIWGRGQMRSFLECWCSSLHNAIPRQFFGINYWIKKFRIFFFGGLKIGDF